MESSGVAGCKSENLCRGVLTTSRDFSRPLSRPHSNSEFCLETMNFMRRTSESGLGKLWRWRSRCLHFKTYGVTGFITRCPLLRNS